MSRAMSFLFMAVFLGVFVTIFLVTLQQRRKKPLNARVLLSAFFGIVLLVLGVTAFADSVVQIEAGTVGVVKRFGDVVGVFTPGLHFKTPFIDEVIVYRTQEIIYETSENPEYSNADYRDFEVDTATSDGQQIRARYTVRFRIRPERAPDILRNLGTEQEVVERVVKAASRVIVRNTLKKYPASDLYSGNVELAQDEIAAKLRDEFERAGLELTFFGLRSIQFTDEYKAAVERKQIEAENIITKKNLAEQAKFEKERLIIEAEAEAERQRLERIGIAQGEAEARRLQAEAEAQAILIQAQAQAEANRLIAESLSEAVIAWQSVQAWNGEFPLIVGSGQFILPSEIFTQVLGEQPASPPPTPTPLPEPESEPETAPTTP
nr:SPFH domain-containing protein [Ardenticatena sp.]